jgi:hypothetical protein
VGDAGHAAIATSRARLARAGAAISIERCGDVCAPEVDVRIEAERVDRTHVRVRLVAPHEPLAWAVGSSAAAARGDSPRLVERPFHAAWRSERVPGVRPRPAETEALVPVAEGHAVRVRVFADDGAVGELAVRVDAAPLEAHP